MKILIPVDASENCHAAVRHVVKRFMNDPSIEVHLLNVQPPLGWYVSRFLRRRTVREFYRSEADKALGPCRRILDGFGVPYAVHMEQGALAEHITQQARRLRCDEIVMATARKNSLTRLLENSVTNRVLELTPVPVEVIAGGTVSRWEQYGIPAAIAALLAFWLAAAD